MGVKHDGSKARFSLFRTLIDFQSKNMARLKQARKYNLTFFGVLELTGILSSCCSRLLWLMILTRTLDINSSPFKRGSSGNCLYKIRQEPIAMEWTNAMDSIVGETQVSSI